MNKIEKKAYFKEEWLNKGIYPHFDSWLMKGKNNTQARCKLCNKIIELSNMGIQAIKSHEKGKNHVSVASNFSCFFKSSGSKNTNSPNSVEESNLKTTDSFSTGQMKQQSLELIVSSSNKICAEIMWALHCCLNRISNNSNKNVTNLFQAMFPDSEIAKSLQMGPNKVGYSITHGLGPYFKGLLKQQMSLSPWLVVSFDESLNKKTQTCQMDLLIRYWNEEKMQVEVRYWDSSFMGHSTSLDLVNHFNEKISDINISKIVQVSMDGPSVNLKFHRDIQSKREEHKLSKLIDIGCCSLHIIHGAFKTGVESTDWELKKHLKGALPYFMILLPEEVTLSVSLKVLCSRFHFAQPDGLKTKRSRID
ncbi:uncharacterized protein LOC124818972 [Hydra vulgaris]|uniref:uncharacterized protein LOC124818972 n=1 Tax=Hydra vulgaris TaxID=6087 RepID=UPI0032EA2D24